MKVKPLPTLLACAAVLVAGAALFAQSSAPQPNPEVPKVGNAHLWAEVGSFKLEGNGTVDVKFTGTLLVSQAEGQPAPEVKISGNIRKEFDNAEMGRRAWFGTGTAKITGSWRHLTVFGKSMDAKWRGAGIAMVYGEFDAKGKTGFITVDGSEPFEWANTGLAFYVPSAADPRVNQSPESNPRGPREFGGGQQPIQGR